MLMVSYRIYEIIKAYHFMIKLYPYRHNNIAGSHVMEGLDGKFFLLRGTNINESLHKRLNHIWPEKVCIIVTVALIVTLFSFFLYNVGRRGIGR